MLATLCYLADLETENLCGAYTWPAEQFGISISSGALPRHISLGTPAKVKDMDAFLQVADHIADQLHVLHPVLNGKMDAKAVTSNGRNICWAGFHYHELPQLEDARALVSKVLHENGFGFDGNDPIFGTRNLTLLTGQGDINAFKSWASSQEEMSEHPVCFDKLGVFFYEGETFGEGSYFCCKRYPLAN